MDSTKFTGWDVKEIKLIEVTVCNRICKQTVYPIGISFLKDKVVSPVKEAVPQGRGFLYVDAWYDDNATIKELFEKGYFPVVCPNKNRYRGYWRKKARRIYRQPINRLGYRQRGRGEIVFGALTNCYGDRLDAVNITAMQTRIAARTLSYQIKLLIRVGNVVLVLIVRHVPFRGSLSNNSQQ